MSTCTCTYLSTVTKNSVLMSTTEYFFKFQSGRKKKVNCFSGPYLFQMPLICLFSDLKKKWPHLFFSDAKIKILGFYA